MSVWFSVWFAWVGVAFATPPEGRIEVTVPTLDGSPGPVVFRLYDSSEDWLRTPVREIQVPSSTGSVQARFEGIAPGTYAVGVWHDQDGNGEMATGWFGIPAEAVGSSNNPRPRLGPPRWVDAKFELTDAPVQLDVRLVY